MHQYETSKKPKISREKELETVLKISQAVSRTLNLNKILEMACRMTAQALGVERCSIGMVTSKDIYEIVHSYRAKASYPSIAGVKFDLAEYPQLTAAYFSGKPIHLFDMNKRSLSSMEMKLFKKLNLKVFLGIPIVVGGEVLGALHPGKVADPLPFSVSQIRLCQTIANQVGIAIRNAKLVNDLKDRYEQQSLLQNLSKSFFEVLNLQKLFNRITREICRVLDVDRCAVATLDQDRAEVVIRSIFHYRTPKSSVNGRTEASSLVQKFELHDFRHFYKEIQKRGFFKSHSILSSPLGTKGREYLKTTGIKSSLMVPIFSGSRVAGVLNISTVRDYHIFTDSEIKLCQTIANLASLALENANLMDEIKDKSERIRKQLKEEAILLDISRALSRTLNLQDLLKIVTRKAAELLGIERVAAMLVDESTGEIFSYTVYYRGRHQTEIEGAPENIKDFPVLMNCVRTKQLFCASDISRAEISPRELDYFKRRGVKSVLDIPFAVGHRILGILALNTIKEYHEFTESEINLTRALGSQLSVAIYNARLLKDLREKNLEQRVLLDIGKSLSRASDLKRLFGMVTQEAADHLRFERSGITLVEEITGRAYFASLYFQGRHRHERESIMGNPADFPEIFKQLKRKRLFCTSNIFRSQISAKEKEIFRKHEIKSILIVPFFFERRFQGLFSLSTVSEHHDFSKSEIRLSQAIANQLSVAVENARLIEVLKKRSEELKKLSLEVINAQEKEKKNLAGKLHDLVAQDLSAVQLNLKLSQRVLPGGYTEILARLIESEQLLGNSINSLRNLTSDLRPPVLDDLGLATALKWYVKRFKERTNAKITLNIKGTIPNISPEIVSSIYRIIQEGLANVAKHSQASRATVSIGQENHHVRVTIQDNGIGFDPDSLRVTEGYGLFRLRETAGLLGGKVEILSGHGKGTKLIIVLPWKSG